MIPANECGVDFVALSRNRRTRECGLRNTLWGTAHDAECSDLPSWLQELWLALTTSRQQNRTKHVLITWLG